MAESESDDIPLWVKQKHKNIVEMFIKKYPNEFESTATEHSGKSSLLKKISDCCCESYKCNIKEFFPNQGRVVVQTGISSKTSDEVTMSGTSGGGNGVSDNVGSVLSNKTSNVTMIGTSGGGNAVTDTVESGLSGDEVTKIDTSGGGNAVSNTVESGLSGDEVTKIGTSGGGNAISNDVVAGSSNNTTDESTTSETCGDGNMMSDTAGSSNTSKNNRKIQPLLNVPKSFKDHTQFALEQITESLSNIFTNTNIGSVVREVEIYAGFLLTFIFTLVAIISFGQELINKPGKVNLFGLFEVIIGCIGLIFTTIDVIQHLYYNRCNNLK